LDAEVGVSVALVGRLDEQTIDSDSQARIIVVGDEVGVGEDGAGGLVAGCAEGEGAEERGKKYGVLDIGYLRARR
jgi:hypothetical protein